MTSIQKLCFFATPPHDCNYLPGREATTLFADPRFPKNTRLYTALSDCGFRRSGEHLYVPHCSSCASCIPVRIPVREFIPNRNQKRNWKGNLDLTVTALPPEFNRDHFRLYERYLSHRHAGGGMENPTPETYMEFLTSTWADTIFYEMRRDQELLGVTVADQLDDALSAVYTFYDPAQHRRSLGRFAILFLIEKAREQGLEWVYLGYWIERCRKMNYKNEYQPLEYYSDNRWRHW
ncbi:MAG: arginyltransferase [Gammaproteobacteria bacterium]|jgi:arginyl-tRNA--protein-N-Asp/Glu arginylyltransferase